MRRPSITFLRARDTLRKIRYTVRHEAGLIDRTLGAIGAEFGPRSLPLQLLPDKPALQFSDAVFGSLEKAARIALQEPGELRVLSGPVKPISFLLSDTSLNNYARGPSDFVTIIYRYVRHLLRGLPVENVYVSEHAIESVRQNLQSRHAALIAEIAEADRSKVTDAKDFERQVELCAALACEIEMARPIRRFDIVQMADTPSQAMMESPNRFCALVIGLALAIASKRPAAVTMKTSEILESGGLVVQARFCDFNAAMDAPSPVQSLTGEFARVLPYLP
ncbi:hypothetical protein MHY87_12525 [Microvirga sp. ACRRW]|uniref:hypothetical protein n=1 Tax=Microvirga sp. ACRRW TaxID=2918205 RepID=UPI001EF590D3|nr:hypothetical protein [Microvirga sp. ACRRW]MCG7393734.1 hypothetical protein [Microvirga sp. ACRRW]